MRRLRFAALFLALAGLGGLAVPATPVAASTSVPLLTAIRAAHHPGYDRLVFEFRGPLPAHRTVRYVPQLYRDGSGLPVQGAGSARLLVSVRDAAGHNNANRVTYGPASRVYALPKVIQVKNIGDFESVLTFGVGLARQTPMHVHLLRQPSRVVVDVLTPYRTVNVRDYFMDSHRFAIGREPYVRPVLRPVTAGQCRRALAVRSCRARAEPSEVLMASSRGSSSPRTTAWMCRTAPVKEFWSPPRPGWVTGSPPAAWTSNRSCAVGWNGLVMWICPPVPSSRVNVLNARVNEHDSSSRRPPGKPSEPHIARSTPSGLHSAAARADSCSAANRSRARRTG